MRNNESIQPMESRQALALSDYLIMRCLMFPRCVSRCLREFGRVFANTAVSNIANSGLRWIRCPTVFLCLVHAASEVSNCIATGMLCSLVARAAVWMSTFYVYGSWTCFFYSSRRRSAALNAKRIECWRKMLPLHWYRTRNLKKRDLKSDLGKFQRQLWQLTHCLAGFEGLLKTHNIQTFTIQHNILLEQNNMDFDLNTSIQTGRLTCCGPQGQSSVYCEKQEQTDTENTENEHQFKI